MSSCEEESIGRQIYICGQAMRNYADQKLKNHDLTVEQLHILKQLYLAAGQTQSQLCEGVGKSPANITRILDRLEKKGRVNRKNNPGDRRSTLVFLTEEGEVLEDQVHEQDRQRQDGRRCGLDPEAGEHERQRAECDHANADSGRTGRQP